jgi:hypothetical protein
MNARIKRSGPALTASSSSFAPMRSNLLERRCACGGKASFGGECDTCRRKRSSSTSSAIQPMLKVEPGADPVFDRQALEGGLRSPGQPLDAKTRDFMESRFARDFSGVETQSSSSATIRTGLADGASPGRLEEEAEAMSERVTQMPAGARSGRWDFSRVRVHTDARAAASARAVNARAYTVGHDVVFGAGAYAPRSGRGVRLLAHELAHVVQQGGRARPGLLQRFGFGDVRLAAACSDLQDKIRATPAFKALAAGDVKLTEEIIIEVGKRSLTDRYHFLSKLKALFDTPTSPPATITAQTQTGTATAVKAEKTRLAKPAAAVNTRREEKASGDPKRTWVPIPGKFGGGTYYVDRTSPTNIVIKADIYLAPKGTGTAKDVASIKSMEDGIEKAASTGGYTVDIRFVNSATPTAFKVDVDPSKWEVATNWSGGDPVGFAHELHHMFAFELDRYDYIESHSENTSMEIPDRLHWFREELKKPPNYNDPTSIMNSASHPNDDDACRTAGLDLATCLPARAAARAAGKI